MTALCRYLTFLEELSGLRAEIRRRTRLTSSTRLHHRLLRMAAKRARRTASSERGTAPLTRRFWRDRYAETPYDELPWFEAGASRSVRLAYAERFFPKRGSILDIGCGAGSNVLFLARKGFRALGIDLSPGAVEAARTRAAKERLKIDVREGDALALPFAKAKLDGAIDHGCFHTLPLRRRRAYTREVSRVIRPAGKFVLAWVAREFTADWGPPHRPSLEEITRLFEPTFLFNRTGFESGGKDGVPSSYFAFLTRRSGPQPPPR